MAFAALLVVSSCATLSSPADLIDRGLSEEGLTAVESGTARYQEDIDSLFWTGDEGFDAVVSTHVVDWHWPFEVRRRLLAVVKVSTAEGEVTFQWAAEYQDRGRDDMTTADEASTFRVSFQPETTGLTIGPFSTRPWAKRGEPPFVVYQAEAPGPAAVVQAARVFPSAFARPSRGGQWLFSAAVDPQQRFQILGPTGAVAASVDPIDGGTEIATFRYSIYDTGDGLDHRSVKNLIWTTVALQHFLGTVSRRAGGIPQPDFYFHWESHGKEPPVVTTGP